MSASEGKMIVNQPGQSAQIADLRIVDGAHRMIAVSWLAGSRRGRTDVVCLSPLIDTHKFYAPIRRNSELFETVHLIDDGFALAWGNESIDMSASSVERLAEEAMSGKDFCEFLKRNALTHLAAAAALGRSKRQIENYVQYEALPRMVVLACIGYEARKALTTCTAQHSLTTATVYEGFAILSGLGTLPSESLKTALAEGWNNAGLNYCGRMTLSSQGWTVPLQSAAIISHKQREHG